MSTRALVILALTVSTPTFVLLKDATANECRAALANGMTDVQLNNILEKAYNFHQRQGFETYKRVSEAKPIIAQIIPNNIVRTVVADTLTPYYGQALKTILTKLEQTQNPTRDQVKEAFRDYLKNVVPARQVEARVAKLDNLTADGLKQALGEMTLAEVQESMYGRDPLHPSADSLLGRYMSETGARSVTRTFSKGPEKAGQEGAARLAVAVSQASFEVFQKYFTNINMLMHVHTPRQGTLMTSHNGRVGSYGDIYTRDMIPPAQLQQHAAYYENLRQRSMLNLPTPGSILPTVLLSTSEGNRATNFFILASGNRNALTPWAFQNERNEAYCAIGGYESCTHWIGNIPVGDRTVEAYTFPGKVDKYAYNPVPNEPQTKPLTPINTAQNELAALVWTAPGHEQLSHVLGVAEQNSVGEMASPGYVAVTLTSQTAVNRVPVVFVSVQDHRVELQANFDTQVNAF